MIRRLLVLSTIARLVLFLALASSAAAAPGIQSEGPVYPDAFLATWTVNVGSLIDPAAYRVSDLPHGADRYISSTHEGRRCAGGSDLTRKGAVGTTSHGAAPVAG